MDGPGCDLSWFEKGGEDMNDANRDDLGDSSTC